MPDQIPIPGTTVDPAAGGETAPTAEELAAAEAAKVAAAAAAAAAKKAKGSNVTAPKRREIVIPEAEFKKRVDREAAKNIQKMLGCTLEEAQARLKAAATGAPAPAPAAGGAAPLAAAPRPGNDVATEALRKKNRDLERRLEIQRAKTKKVKLKERDKRLEVELRHSAILSGIKPEAAAYAMTRYRDKLRATPEGEELPDPDVFWPTLRESEPFVFAGEAPAPRVVPLRATTAPPESTAPGEERPRARVVGSAPPARDVFAEDDRTFADKTAAKYGYRPPQSA